MASISLSTLGSPPRKRLRSSEEEEADITLIDVDATGIGEIVRDPLYYKTSGDCKIRVEDTLFNVCESQTELPAV